MLLLTQILSLRMVTKIIMPPFLLSKILMHNVEQGAMTVTFTHLGMHFSYYYDLLQIIQSMAFLLYYKVCTSSDQNKQQYYIQFSLL